MADRDLSHRPASTSASMTDFLAGHLTTPSEAAMRQEQKIRCGQLVSVDDVVRRCPELEAEIKELLPMIAALEKMKAAENKDQARLAMTLPSNPE